MSGLKTERIPVMFEKELVEKIDDFSFSNRIRSRSEAIRRLVEQSLTLAENEKGPVSA